MSFTSIFVHHSFTVTPPTPGFRLFFIRQKINKQKNRDNSIQSAPSPYLWYSLTHVHRSIGYHNRNPQSLCESVGRLMYLRVYDSRDTSCKSAPSPSLWHSLTHAHITLPTSTVTPHSSRSHVLRSFGFLCVWSGLHPPASWPLGRVLLYVYPHNPVYPSRFRSLRFGV